MIQKGVKKYDITLVKLIKKTDYSTIYMAEYSKKIQE